MSGWLLVFFFSSRRRHTRWTGDWSSDVCSSDLRFGPDPRERGRAGLDCDGPAHGPHAGPCGAGESKARERRGRKPPGGPARAVRRARGGGGPHHIPPVGAGRVHHRERDPDRWRAIPRVALSRRVTAVAAALDLPLRLLARDVRARPARPAGGAVPRPALAALPGVRGGGGPRSEAEAGHGGPARPADGQRGLVHDAAVRAIPRGAEELRELPRAEVPIDPREDDAADEENQERAGQEVVHVGENSRARVI